MNVVRVPGQAAGTPTVVTIGNFYAVHRGHRALIRKVRRLAQQMEAESSDARVWSSVLTFEPHPQQVLRGEAPPALVTPAGKLKLLEGTGIDQTVILGFTRELSRVEPEEFIEQILVKDLGVRAVVVGEDFRFGRFARGDVTMLQLYGRRLGFGVEAEPLARMQDGRISSSAIRHALEQGDVRWAAEALGRPYTLSGKVVHGAGRGRGLGFPTANLRPAPGVCVPGPGIYAGHTVVDARRLVSAISVGTNPTFGENPLSVEAFVLDYSGDLYGKEVVFEFNSRLRDHLAFADAQELNQAIAADVEQVRAILG